MIEIKFKKQYLEDLYEGKKSKDNRFRSNQALVTQYIKTVKKLQALSRFEQIYQLKSLNFEALSGDLQGLFSVRINNQFRLIFEVVRDTNPPFDVQLIEIEEISKHYE